MDRDNRSQRARSSGDAENNQDSQSGYGKLNDSYIYGMNAKNRAEVQAFWQITYDSLDPDTVRNLMEIREMDVPTADYWTVQYLAENFGIENVPKIKYDFYEGPFPPDRRGGGMDYYNNTLHIARHRLINGKLSRDDEFKICNIIAHELWHAYQFQEVNKGTRWGKLYEHNFLHYKEQLDILTDATKPGWNTPYEQQLVEREAIAVGTAFERFCRDVMMSPNRVRPEGEFGDNIDDAGSENVLYDGDDAYAGPENDTYDDWVNDYAEQQAILEQYRRSREELRPQTVQDIYDELDDKSTPELVFSLPEIREALKLYAKGETEDFVMDVYDYVGSLNDSTRLMVVEEIAAAVPDFDPEEFLKKYTEVDPVTVCRLVDHVAAVETAPAIEDLEEAVRQEFYTRIQKYPTKSDWREFCWLSYDGYVDDLLEAYQRNGKLSEQEAEAITARREEFYQAILADELRLIEATGAVDKPSTSANGLEENIIDDSYKVSVDDSGEIIADDPNHIPIEEVFENMQLFDLIALFPQVYDSVESDKIYRMIKETLQKVPEEATKNVIALKKQGDLQGSDRLLVDTLREVFDIEHEVNIQYLEPDSVAEGSYNESEHTLYLKRNLDGIDDEFDVIKTIAHEMCHAYQYSQAEKGTDRGREYDLNYKWYISNDYSLDYYYRQLVEMEAFAFEEYFGEFVRVQDIEAFNSNYK